MNRREFITASVAGLMATKLRAQTTSGVVQPVLKRSYDLANTGCNLAENTLTLAKVKAGIRLITTLQMTDDRVGAEAQALLIPSVMMLDGFVHDLLVVLDMAGNAWCWDANSYALLWKQHLANPIVGTTQIDAWNINQYWCFLSTPVVDTNILYAVGWQSPDGTANRGMHYFHTINLKDGSRVKPAIDLAQTKYTATNGTTTAVQSYNTTLRKQRSSLTLATIAGAATVIWCAGTVAETSSTASGWIFAYDIASGKITARTLSDANYGAGVWMAGAAPSVDSKGNIYVVTGNGAFDGVGSFGECAVKLSYAPPSASTAGIFTVVDWFCPFADVQREGGQIPANKETKIAGTNNLSMAMEAQAVNYASYNDQDLGSAQGCLLESLGLYLVCGKDGIVYPVNINNMGKTTPAQLAAGQQYAALAFPPEFFTYFPGYNVSPNPLLPQQLDMTGKTRHMHSTPVPYLSSKNGQTVFCAGENSPIRVWSVTKTGMTFLAQSNEIASAQVTKAAGGMPGMQLTLAASSTGAPILIASCPYGDANQTVTDGRLMVYDAENFVNGVITLLWDSQAEGLPYKYNKFCPAPASGGRIWLNTYQDAVMVFG